MAIVTDPDLLTRYSVIFGSETQRMSVYPVGDTQEGSTLANSWISTTSIIRRGTGDWGADGAAAGNVFCILDGANAGHFYVESLPSATEIQVTDIVDGVSGAAITTLTVRDNTFANTDVNLPSNTINIAAHGYTPGQAVVLDNTAAANTVPIPLSNTQVIFAIPTGTGTAQFANTYADAIANTPINITDIGIGETFKLHDRIITAVFNNGANTSEAINSNDTSGEGDGDVLDGATIQALYSFGKEEWRTDSLITDLSPNYNDDLIRHEFPFEAITSEQFEIGGGTSHDNWTPYNDYTVKKVRTGGWAQKTSTSSNDKNRFTGVITLGSVDPDSQIYYQQVSATTDPVDFTFLGAINEAIEVYQDDNQDASPDFDRTTYLKLFVRKKARSYAQSEIADIGVTTIQTIVNRFPLAHATDAAIISNDADILGVAPFRGATAVTGASGSDGSKTVSQNTFTSAGSNFQTTGVVPGDMLFITSGAESGNYTIGRVHSDTILNVASDFEYTTWSSTESSLSFQVYTPVAQGVKDEGNLQDHTAPGTTNGVLDVATSNGKLFDANATPGANVVAGDYLQITGGVANNEHIGVYKVQSVTNTIEVIVETLDEPFPAAVDTGVTYKLWEPGMFLQYRKQLRDTLDSGSGVTEFGYDDSNPTYGNRPTITLTGDTWDPSVDAGTIIEVNGSTSNDGSYTVVNRETAAIISLLSTDTLVDETDSVPNSTITVYNGFKRTVGSSVFAFNWKVTGNNAGLDDVFQFIQHQLRQSTDIDFGNGTFRGDITDLLMTFASPTGTTINLFIDDVDTNDINNWTLQDHSGVNRNFPFTSAGTLSFNDNLTTDANAKYWLFFTNDDAGADLGRDFGTKDAIIVDDANGNDIQGSVPQGGGTQTVAFTYDYDGNVQRGENSQANNAPVTLVAIGLDGAQYVVSSGTITRTTGIVISAVAALERNYLNAA